MDRSHANFLLIDAFNVIHAVPDLRSQLTKGGWDKARDALAQRVLAIHDAEELNVVLILDGIGDRVDSEYPFRKKSFEYLYAPAALTADGVIERLIARLPDPSGSTAVSNDNLLRETVRALGANALRPDELIDWARASEAQLQRDIERKRRAAAVEWGNRLDFEI